MKAPILFILLLATLPLMSQHAPLKVAVIGLTHAHVHWILSSGRAGDVEVVGIVEANQDLAARYTKQYGYDLSKVHPTMEALFASTTPEAAVAFGSIHDHLAVVEACAPRGIHVMVEKPLAVSTEHAEKMRALAVEHDIHLLTNYETTWYPTNHKAYELAVEDGAIGEIRKVVIRDGHRGPKKIGVNEEFLEWLTDPVLNGGGALIDFGCYGANLLTWLLRGERPQSVTAITQQLQAENNPKVEDEAIILVQYANCVGVIQASWNWPIGRKDLEIYGLTGAVYADNKHQLRLRTPIGYDDFQERPYVFDDRPTPFDDPFAYLAAVIREEVNPGEYDLTGLANNLMVVEILEAATKSARTGRTVEFE